MFFICSVFSIGVVFYPLLFFFDPACFQHINIRTDPEEYTFSIYLSTLCSFLIFYSRLTPVYMFCILFIAKLRPFFGAGPMWFAAADTSACSEHWWTNLLYLNNFLTYGDRMDGVRQQKIISIQHFVK